MEYGICKLRFPYGVHFGNKLLTNSKSTFCADTLFSALCIEALKKGEERMHRLYDEVANGHLLFSDAFPFVGKEYFLPKPFMKVNEGDGDSIQKKQYKKMNYVAMSKWREYLNGALLPETELNLEQMIGSEEVRTHASIRGEEETLPYRIGVYTFQEGAGLYILYGYENEKIQSLFLTLLDGLAYSGIGGKRASGLGRFTVSVGSIPKDIMEGLKKDSERYISLSIALPTDEELSESINGANYMIEKRSGFVESSTYADEYMRKRDLYMFSSGSVFVKRFSGDIYDVSSGGKHPVYRYGKPIFLGV